MLTFWISRFHNSYFSLILRMPTFCISRFHTSWTSKTHNNRAGGWFAGSPKCPKSIQNLQCWSNVGPFLVSFRYTMGLELTFHNFHIHIRALDTRGILLKNMVYHDNNKHIFWPSTSIPTLDLVETFASKPLRPWSHQTACATTLLRTHKYYYSSVHVYARVHTSIYIYRHPCSLLW